MHSLYTRLVLWLIRPALERIVDERIAAAMRPGGAIWRGHAAPPPSPIPRYLSTKVLTRALDAEGQKRFFEAAIGRTDSPAWKTSSPNDDRRRK